MVVFLDLTEDIIDGFNKCVKSGDYKPFIKGNQKFLDKLADNLKYVEFEKDTKYFWISKDFKFCLKYLSKFDPRNPREKIPGVKNLEKNVPEITNDIKDGICRKDWSNFYWKYRFDADYMISEARKQEIIDFTISLGSNGFETFATRDEVFGYMNEEVVRLQPKLNVYSPEFRNSGAMVQNVPELKSNTTPRNVTVIRVVQKFPDSKPPKKEGGSTLKEKVMKKLGMSDNRQSDKTESKDTLKVSKQQAHEGTKSTRGNNRQDYLDERPNNLHNESPANKKQDSSSDVPSRYAADLKSDINYEARSFDLPRFSNEDPTVKIRQTSLNRDSPDLDNSAFEQQLNEQKLRNSRHLEEVRAERRRKQAEFEKELQKMRAESKKRFEVLLACIMMKHRFEEQEQNWKDWIQGCKNHIVDLCNRFADFEDDVHRNHGGLRKTEKVDQEEFQSDKGHLLGKIMMTFNAIQFDFEHLKSIEEKYPDALFVKVLQNCLVKTAYTLLGIYTSLQDLGVDKNEFQQLQDKTANLTPNMIYSTPELHRICSGDNSGKFEGIEFPDFPQFVTVQEVE
ncbi:unnamed protein product [Caenorhabditis brenneri]